MSFVPGKYKLTAVYLMKNRWSEANYKIGVSSDPSRRVLEVNEQYNVDAVVVAQVWLPRMFDAQCSETTWHRRLQEYRTDDHGGKEWFCLTSEQVEEFIHWTTNGLDRGDLSQLIFVKGSSSSHLLNYAKGLRSQIPTKRNAYPRNRVSLWRNHYYSSRSSVSSRCTILASRTYNVPSRKRKTACMPVIRSTASKQLSLSSQISLDDLVLS